MMTVLSRSPLTLFLPAHALLVRPGRAALLNLRVHRAARYVRTRQVADAHEKLAHDLATGKTKRSLEELDPLILGTGMVRGKPTSERPMRISKLHDAPGVGNRGVDLEAIPDDARISEEPSPILIPVSCH